MLSNGTQNSAVAVNGLLTIHSCFIFVEGPYHKKPVIKDRSILQFTATYIFQWVRGAFKNSNSFQQAIRLLAFPSYQSVWA